MLTLTDKLQFQAYLIGQGKHTLAPAHCELMDWITKQFGVTALDFYCETREKQQLVHVILNSAGDIKKLQSNRTNYTLIAERFLQYFKSPERDNSDPLKNNVFPSDRYQEIEVIVTYRPLKELSADVLKEIYAEEKWMILSRFESVWTLSQTVVFYYTDVQVKENSTNGTSAKIVEALHGADKRHGFEQSPTYYFDSKESFDRDYDSKWHYYWK